MGKRALTTPEFIDRAKTKHGQVYDYSRVLYVDQQTKVEIICKDHGSFWQLPSNHAWKGQSCPACADICRINHRTKTYDDFIHQARRVHGDKYEYDPSSYVKRSSCIRIRCSHHGWFEQTPNQHLFQKQGCPTCAGKHKNTPMVIREFKLVHGERYDYTSVVYTSTHTPVSIVCREHGMFQQSPSAHKHGQGCPKCAYTGHHGKYSSLFFDRYPEAKNTPATLYVWRMTSDSEDFIKVGITTTSVKQRVRNNNTTAYSITILQEWSHSLYDAFTLEQKILDLFKHVGYTPKEEFQGRTECLEVACLPDIITLIIGD